MNNRDFVKEVERLLPCSRRDLPYLFGCNERQAREMIYRARENGLPVLMPDRNDNRYRVAETEEEVKACYDAMFNRSVRSLIAAKRMLARYQPDAQTRL